MNRAPRTRFLAVAVVALATLLIVLSRQVGSPGAGSGPRSRRAPGENGNAVPPGEADTLKPGLPPFTFYETLGVTREGQGNGAAADTSPELTPAEADRPPGGAFVIQVLATRDGRQAKQIRDRIRAMGMPAHLIEGVVDGEPIYRVRVGRYRERRTAVAWSEKIQARLGLTPWVLQEER